ncbi:MAG: hypothetical protein PHI86_05755 [Candidatus Omnitrophica bacterium]|nr:hypothetical protein [Candidatus Omnitrophota bacterium]
MKVISAFIFNIKNRIKKNERIYELIFSLWSRWCLFRAAAIFRKIKHVNVDRNIKVIIYGLRTIPTTSLVYFDAIFAHAFKKLGCETKILYCDGVFASCDADTYFRSQKPACNLCRYYGQAFKKAINLDSLSFKEFISPEEIRKSEELIAEIPVAELKNYTYLGVNIGIQARASTIRYFLTGELDYNRRDQVAMLRKKIAHGMNVVKIANQVYQKEKPQVIFMMHGIYSSWGPFFDFFRTKNVDVVVYYNMPHKLGFFLFTRNGRDYDLAFADAWEKIKKRKLVKREQEEIDSYLSSRFKGTSNDQLMYGKNFNNKKSEYLRLISSAGYKRKYVLFPNLAWDACVEVRGNAIFDDMLSWINKTIKYFREKPDYLLVIKPHPGEIVWELGELGTISIREYISKHNPHLPKNIIILPPDVPLKAYELAAKDTICLTLAGSIGIELATQAIPVIVTGNMHYKDAGIVYQVKDQQEYFTLLDNPQKVVAFAENNQELAKKYAYYWFFRLFHRVPFYKDDVWSKFDWRAVKDINKLFADDGQVMKIANKIIHGEDMVAPL